MNGFTCAGEIPVRSHFAAIAERMQEGGRSLPRYVVAEFEAFARCGVLA